ncbi:MAG: cytochrome P450 [Acidimicrobiales bacterium]
MTDIEHFDPLADEVLQSPWASYASIRREQPVMYLDGGRVGRPGEDVYCVSRYDDVRRVLVDPTTFSSRAAIPMSRPSKEVRAQLREIVAEGWPEVSTLLTEDPPSHTRYRSLVSKAFTPKRLSETEPRLREICEELVAGFDRQPVVDFMAHYAVPIPVRAVAEVLEVPDTRQADFKRWADQSVSAIGRDVSDEQRIQAQRAIVEQQHYFAGEIEARREHPRDDFLSDLLHARLTNDDDVEGEPLSMPEMLSIIRQIQVAGSETTASLLAELMVFMSDHPDQWEMVKQDPSRIPAVIEEALRLASPNQGLFRMATVDASVGGVAIPAGSTLWVMFGSANRDEDVFAAAEEFSIDRTDHAAHLAFGKGPHYCLGAALARLEARVALEVLANNVDTISLGDDPDLRYAPSYVLRGLEQLDVQFTYR